MSIIMKSEDGMKLAKKMMEVQVDHNVTWSRPSRIAMKTSWTSWTIFRKKCAADPIGDYRLMCEQQLHRGGDCTNRLGPPLAIP